MVKRFPDNLRNRGVKDPEMIAWFCEAGNPLVTTDKALHIAHAASIPNQHPGIIVLAAVGNYVLSSRLLISLIGEFKSHVPGWQDVDFANSVVELWSRHEYDVFVYRYWNGQELGCDRFRYSSEGWLHGFLETLHRNATANPAQSPE